jgi:hypothetical protein
MLLPHPIILYPNDFIYLAAVSTSIDSFLPNVKYYIEFSHYVDIRLPQPLKSKHAKPTLSGSKFKYNIASTRDEELPCKYRIT